MKGIKRVLDIIISVLLLGFTSLIFIVASIGVKLASKGPILFKQERIGLQGKPFEIYKFRTMLVNTEERTLGRYISKEEEAITAIGKFLRRWAIDELPQLWNVIKGDMSLVGPRPTLKYQVDKYDDHQWKRLNVKPGITGWAQVNGRNLLSWPDRIEQDIWYVDNWSLFLDIKIMLMTIPALLRKDFAFAEENVGDDEIVRLDE
ncbi:MAG: sugar transferase [Candidatus Omnitrophota bacterium]|jgi:lipopolysaccharide/colanic/teichoic acid biosynthesis glycosyltransferase|nr:MAG: sugar transferase [Candidatus Omnitrophota bacterium]